MFKFGNKRKEAVQPKEKFKDEHVLLFPNKYESSQDDNKGACDSW